MPRPDRRLLATCARCHRLHVPDRPLALHPVCDTCVQALLGYAPRRTVPLRVLPPSAGRRGGPH